MKNLLDRKGDELIKKMFFKTFLKNSFVSYIYSKRELQLNMIMLACQRANTAVACRLYGVHTQAETHRQSVMVIRSSRRSLGRKLGHVRPSTIQLTRTFQTEGFRGHVWK